MSASGSASSSSKSRQERFQIASVQARNASLSEKERHRLHLFACWLALTDLIPDEGDVQVLMDAYGKRSETLEVMRKRFQGDTRDKLLCLMAGSQAWLPLSAVMPLATCPEGAFVLLRTWNVDPTTLDGVSLAERMALLTPMRRLLKGQALAEAMEVAFTGAVIDTWPKKEGMDMVERLSRIAPSDEARKDMAMLLVAHCTPDCTQEPASDERDRNLVAFVQSFPTGVHMLVLSSVLVNYPLIHSPQALSAFGAEHRDYVVREASVHNASLRAAQQRRLLRAQREARQAHDEPAATVEQSKCDLCFQKADDPDKPMNRAANVFVPCLHGLCHACFKRLRVERAACPLCHAAIGDVHTCMA